MSILKNINFLRKLNRIPCGVPSPLIVIETAFESAPPALLSLFQPDCNDIVKLRIGQSPWHLRGIKGLIEGAVGAKALGAKKFLFEVGYFEVEKFLWWWQVAEVTAEFITTWQTMIYQEQQCQLPGAGTARAIFTPFGYPPNSGGALSITPTHNVHGVFFGGGLIRILPGFEATVVYWSEWESVNPPGQPVDVSTWYTEDDGNVIQDLSHTNDPIALNGNRVGGSFFVPPVQPFAQKTYHFWGQNNGDNIVRPRFSSIQISLLGRQMGNLSFGCHLKPVEWPFPPIT
jgi:hypothetical protein